MYFGEWAGKSGPDFPFHTVAQRVRTLVGEFQRYDTTMAARTEGWRQVVRFLVLLRTVGLTTNSTNGSDGDPGCEKHLREDDKQSIDAVSRSRTNHESKVSVRFFRNGGGIIYLLLSYRLVCQYDYKYSLNLTNLSCNRFSCL
uniref:Uncharacterized protein n=1 Tax=Anopheles culicifacies TaxID=139723 RepID=A0A182MX18_9DIPT